MDLRTHAPAEQIGDRKLDWKYAQGHGGSYTLGPIRDASHMVAPGNPDPQVELQKGGLLRRSPCAANKPRHSIAHQCQGVVDGKKRRSGLAGRFGRETSMNEPGAESSPQLNGVGGLLIAIEHQLEIAIYDAVQQLEGARHR